MTFNEICWTIIEGMILGIIAIAIVAAFFALP
jgi:hypothetical protein